MPRYRQTRPFGAQVMQDSSSEDEDGNKKPSKTNLPPELEDVVKRIPGARVARSDDDPETLHQLARASSQENPDEIRMQLEGLTEVRLGMSMEERLDKAEETKYCANEHFKAGKWRTSMVGYVAAIWFLKHGNPPCPKMVASDTRGWDEIESFLGAGTEAAIAAAATEPQPDSFATLRNTCHLNIAQAALKQSEWGIARRACEYVLSVDGQGSNAKALFRLAKAHEGDGELGKAAFYCNRLLKAEPDNKDGRKLLESINARKAKQKKAFTGVFERAQAEGDGLYTAAEERQQRLDEEQRAINFADGLPDGPNANTKVLRGNDLKNMTQAQQDAFVKQINESLDYTG